MLKLKQLNGIYEIAIEPKLNPFFVRQDSEKNRIKQWKETELKMGVFSAELSLSESPVLGDWTIIAEVDEEVKFQSTCALH